MGIDPLAKNDAPVQLLYEFVQEGRMGLEQAPKLLKEVLLDECWRERRVRTGEVVKFLTFAEFVTTPPIKGLGVSMKLINRIASVDKDLETLVAKAKIQPEGGARNPNGINQYAPKELVTDDNIIGDLRTAPNGTSSQQACLRLSRQAPEIHARVLAGELSPHAAMIQAGFRRKTITVPCDPDLAVKALLRHFDRDAIDRILYLIPLLRETP